MKKTILAILVLVSIGAFAQKDKEVSPYFFKGSLITNWEKKDSMNPGKTWELNIRGLYGGFAYEVDITQPFNNKSNWGLRQMKSATLGYGIHKRIAYGQNTANNSEGYYHLSAAIGPTLMLTPKPDSVKTKNNNDLFIGGTVFANINSEQSGLEGEAKLMVVMLPRNNDTVWSETVVTPEIQVKKFFAGAFGLSAGYRLLFYTTNERQVQGKPYHGTVVSSTRSEISLGICGKWKSVTLSGGILIPREKFKMSDNTGLRPTNFFQANTQKTSFTIGIQVNFRNPPSW